MDQPIKIKTNTKTGLSIFIQITWPIPVMLLHINTIVGFPKLYPLVFHRFNPIKPKNIVPLFDESTFHGVSAVDQLHLAMEMHCCCSFLFSKVSISFLFVFSSLFLA